METDRTADKELWTMIFEKAWAKLHGSYESIEGGETEDALQYLTGACTINRPLINMHD